MAVSDWSPEKDCCWRLTCRHPVRPPSSESGDSEDGFPTDDSGDDSDMIVSCDSHMTLKMAKLVKVSNKTVTSTRSTTHTLGMEDSAISAKSGKSMHRFRVNILLLSNEGFVRFCFLYACSDPTIVLFYSCRLQLYKSLDSSQ